MYDISINTKRSLEKLKGEGGCRSLHCTLGTRREPSTWAPRRGKQHANGDGCRRADKLPAIGAQCRTADERGGLEDRPNLSFRRRSRFRASAPRALAHIDGPPGTRRIDERYVRERFARALLNITYALSAHACVSGKGERCAD